MVIWLMPQSDLLLLFSGKLFSVTVTEPHRTVHHMTCNSILQPGQQVGDFLGHRISTHSRVLMITDAAAEHMTVSGIQIRNTIRKLRKFFDL